MFFEASSISGNFELENEMEEAYGKARRAPTQSYRAVFLNSWFNTHSRQNNVKHFTVVCIFFANVFFFMFVQPQVSFYADEISGNYSLHERTDSNGTARRQPENTVTDV